MNFWGSGRDLRGFIVIVLGVLGENFLEMVDRREKLMNCNQRCFSLNVSQLWYCVWRINSSVYFLTSKNPRNGLTMYNEFMSKTTNLLRKQFPRLSFRKDKENFLKKRSIHPLTLIYHRKIIITFYCYRSALSQFSFLFWYHFIYFLSSLIMFLKGCQKLKFYQQLSEQKLNCFPCSRIHFQHYFWAYWIGGKLISML